MSGFGTEELEGLRLRVQSQLMLLQEQLTSIGRIEQDLGALGAQMARVARHLPDREGVFVKRLQAALAQSATVRDHLEEDLGAAFEAAEEGMRSDSTSGSSSRGAKGHTALPAHVRWSPAMILADLGPSDTLLFASGGVRFAVQGRLESAAPDRLGSQEAHDAFPRLPGAEAFVLRRVRDGRLFSCERILGRVRRSPRSSGFRLEQLGRPLADIQGRFRLRGRWYYLLA